MKRLAFILSILFLFSCSKTAVAVDADVSVDNDNSTVEQDTIDPDDDFVDSDDDSRGDDSSRPDSDDDSPLPDGDLDDSDDDITPDSDVILDGDVIVDEDVIIFPDDPFEDVDDDVSFDEDFELPDSDKAFTSCSNHQICTEIVPMDSNRYCYYNRCWEIGDIAWEITLYDFEIDSAYFAEKFPGVAISTISYRIDIAYKSSGGYQSYTGTEVYIKADKLSGVVLRMFTATPFSYSMRFFEQNPQTQVSYGLGWYVSSKVTHGEIGNGDFTVQLEMYGGPIKVKVKGRFIDYIY